MYQRDYILRMIEQMTSMIANVAGLRKEQKQKQAFELLDEMLGRFFRLNSKLLNTLSESDLISMMTVNGFLETEKLKMLAGLLKEEGEVFDSMEQPEEGYRRYLKALQLCLAVYETEPTRLPADLRLQMDEVLVSIKGFYLPAPVKKRLVPYFEASGRFASAEDMLYDLLEEGQSVTAEGKSFYERLLAKTDSELAAGNLPREEVVDGMEEWIVKTGEVLIHES